MTMGHNTPSVTAPKRSFLNNNFISIFIVSFFKIIKPQMNRVFLLSLAVPFSVLLSISCEKENIPPTCEITSPQNNTEYEVGDLITISVEANDEDGMVLEVRFYIDSLDVALATSSPYTYKWNTEAEENGIKKIKVGVKDDKGEVAEDEITIQLDPAINPPVAEFTASPTTIIEGETVQFTDQSTNDPTEWSWDFGDGSIDSSQNPSHRYIIPGYYEVSLTTTNSGGSDSEIKSKYITVAAQKYPPVAEFTASPLGVNIGDSVRFIDHSTNGPTVWHWNFGDGSKSSLQNPSHTYTKEGFYEVSLYVRSSAGIDMETKSNFILVKGTNTYGSVTDIEGNVYKTIIIDNQEYMAENLKTTKYNEGTNIPLVTETMEWTYRTTPGYCWYDNNEISYKDTYGALYNWYTVNTGKLCPSGWHVPTNEEWIELENFLIENGYNYDNTNSGDKLAKSLASTTGWDFSYDDGDIGCYPEKNNRTGFTALPAGRRNYAGGFQAKGVGCYFWSSTLSTTGYPHQRSLWNFNSSFDSIDRHHGNGYSIRCIKD